MIAIMRLRTGFTKAAMLVLALCVAMASDGVAQDKASKPDAKSGDASDGKGAKATFVLRRHEMKDPLANNMVSHTILVPKGWKLEGGAWYPNLERRLFRMNPSRDIKVTSPEGVELHYYPIITAVDYFPEPGSPMQRPKEGMTDDGLPVIYMPTTLAAWKKRLVEVNLPAVYPKGKKFTIKEAAVEKEHTAAIRKLLVDPMNQQFAQQVQMMPGFGSKADGVVWTATVQFEEGGKKWDVHIYTAATWILNGFGTDIRCTKMTWSTVQDFSVKVPAGEFDEWSPILSLVFNSTRVTPEWDLYVLKIIMKRAGKDIEHAGELSKIIQENGEHNRKIQREMHENRMASKDRISDGTSKMIRGVEDYRVPGSKATVELTPNYRHVFTNNKGEYIFSNDSTYNPNADRAVNKEDWKAMEQVKRK